jgi:H+-transporting ATPase
MCKLGFSTTVLAIGKYRLGLNPGELQTLAFVTLIFGAQGLLFVVRERRHLWSSRPSKWVVMASATDIAVVSMLALSGTLMEPLPWRVLATVFATAVGFTFILDQVKLPVRSAFKVV